MMFQRKKVFLDVDNEKTTPTRYIYYPTYQPTKTIIVKQKHKHHNKTKRHVKVRINKQHRKIK